MLFIKLVIKNMKKIILSAVALALALPFAASAASITNVEYQNGDVTVQGNAGQSVSGKVRVVVANNEEVERVQFDVISDNLAPVCVDVGRLQEGTHFISIPGDVKFPPNTGTYSLEVKTAGLFGGLAAIDCTSNVNGSNSFGSSVRTVGGSTTYSGSTDSLMALIATLQAQIGCMISGGTWDATAKACGAKPAPAKPAYCATRVAYNGSNAFAAQAWLMANGFAGPFGAIGVYAPTGFWGAASTAANAQAVAACQ